MVSNLVQHPCSHLRRSDFVYRFDLQGGKLEKIPVNRAVISINFLIVRLLRCVLRNIIVCIYNKNILPKAEEWDFFSIFAI